MVNKRMLENKTLPKTMTIDGKARNFPNSPDTPNSQTAICICIKLLLFSLIKATP